MPYKMYCDRCNYEISTNWVSSRAIISLEGWKAEVMLCNPKHVWNDGILCEDCLHKLLTEGSYRPKGKGD